MTAKVVTVSCVNFRTTWGDKGANLKKMGSFIVQAAKLGSNLVVFPELALSGYECSEGAPPCQMHENLAETIPGPSTEEIAKVAKKHDIYVVFGMPETDKTDPKVRYISSAVVGPEGILGVYRKLHLEGPPAYSASLCFKAGDSIPVFKTKFGIIGVQICYDFYFFPEITRIQVLKGAEIVCNCTASPSGPGKPQFLVQQAKARATENWIFTANANLVGIDRTKTFYGHSTIAGPSYPRLTTIYAEAEEDEEMVTAALNFKLVQSLADLLPWKKVRQTSLFAEELKQLV